MSGWLGDFWTTLRTGAKPPSITVRSVELGKYGELTGEALRARMKSYPDRWWVMYVRADADHLVVEFWNRRFAGRSQPHPAQEQQT